MNWRTECPLLAAFMDSAAYNNSMPRHLHVETVEASDDELCQAEEELMALLGESKPTTEAELLLAAVLGVQADDGYTMYTPSIGDELPKPMMCFDLLDRSY